MLKNWWPNQSACEQVSDYYGPSDKEGGREMGADALWKGKTQEQGSVDMVCNKDMRNFNQTTP